MFASQEAFDHDRAPISACRDTKSLHVSTEDGPTSRTILDATLDALRLEGAIFFRSELSEAFAFGSTPLALADALHAGAERLILFHIVAKGSCWMAGNDGERHRASRGDVIVLPYGDRHTIGGEVQAEPIPITELFDPLPWDDIPNLRHGGGGARTDLVCGYLYSEDPLFDPGMRASPRFSSCVYQMAPVPAGSRRASPTRSSTAHLDLAGTVRSPPAYPNLC
jgi:hypothetical protein